MQELLQTINVASLVLFIVGMALITIELFVPGLGIFGGLGLVALILCIVFQAKTLLEGLILFLIISVLIFVLALIVARSFRKGFLYRSSLVLKNNADKDEGYISNEDYSHLVGKQGVSLTPLRPSGMVDINGERADVVTDGEFIKRGEKVVVTKVSGRRIIVKKVEAE